MMTDAMIHYIKLCEKKHDEETCTEYKTFDGHHQKLSQTHTDKNTNLWE